MDADTARDVTPTQQSSPDVGDMNEVEGRLRGLLGRSGNRPKYLEEQEAQWRQWQTKKKRMKAQNMSSAKSEEIEEEFSRAEFGLGGAEDRASRADMQQDGDPRFGVDEAEVILANVACGNAASEEGVAEAGFNFKSNAKERRQQRRMRVIAKSVRVHLTRALRSGRATKRRPDLAYLGSQVRLTEVIMSSDVGHATILWTPLSTFDTGEVDQIEEDLNALSGPLRSGAGSSYPPYSARIYCAANPFYSCCRPLCLP